MRRLCLLAALAAGSTFLHAQCSSTPCIASLQSSPVGSYQGLAPVATNGAAITAGTLTQNFWLLINGSFDIYSSNAVIWTSKAAPGGQSLETVFFNQPFGASLLVAYVPSNLFASSDSAAITVSQLTCTEVAPCTTVASNAATFTVNAPLAPLALSAGLLGQSYSQPLASGGTAPFTISYSSGTLPPGLTGSYSSIPNTDLTGIPTTPGNYTFSLQVVDAWQNKITPSYSMSVFVPIPPLVITTSSPLTPATAGVDYGNVISASGGASQTYSYSLAGGALPSAITLSSDGRLVGVPASTGTFTFTVEVTDGAGDIATKVFTLVVNPLPLSITTPSFSAQPAGASLNVTFAAQGGVPPYTFSSSGMLPPNAQLSPGGTLTATLNTPGTYAFTVIVTDSAKNTASRAYTLPVVGTVLAISTISPLAAGKAGVAYPGAQFQATGGMPPYTWSASSMPPGMVFSTAGLLAGTPTAAGSYSIAVTVTDSAKATASGVFAITISGGVAITTSSLPNGVVGTPYSAPAMAAAGGIGTLTWSASGLPAGVTLSAAGVFSGTPTAAGAASVRITATDSQGNTASQSYTLTISAPPLSIALAGTVPAVTAGSNLSSLGFTVAGGVAPYTYSVSGLPAGLSVSSGSGGTATVSGTPTAAGSFSVTLTVKDSTGATASTTFSMTVTLPSAPSLSFTGAPSSLNPGSQSTVGVTLGSAFPVDVTVSLTLTFTGTDPAVQFSTGGTTATIVVPAGQTAGATSVGVQTGTVAGTITITTQLTAGTATITPAPAPVTIVVPATAPVIASITAVRNSAGFTVTIVGYSSTLALNTANFTFTGTNLGTTAVSIPVNTIFATWYQSSVAAQYGSNFTYTQSFTTSDPQAVASVAVTLVNGVGTSASASANLQ